MITKAKNQNPLIGQFKMLRELLSISLRLHGTIVHDNHQPKSVEFGELPKTATGMIQKFKLRENEWQGREKQHDKKSRCSWVGGAFLI